ncbi:MAG TPA: ABC transporter permease [Candidatus Angelobacter sp.]|nr:ABC transporter permease [Candidatus Angelobacter sp.]
MNSWLSWLRFGNRRRRDEDFEHELRNHLELEAEELRDAGIPGDEARDRAQRALGNTLRVIEATREVWTWTLLESVTQDIRYGLRMLLKNPAFTTVAVLTLALGIGANTAIFSLVNAVLLRKLPVRDPQQLVVLGDPTIPNARLGGTPRPDVFSYPLYRELRDHNSVFTGLYAAASDHEIEVDAGQGGTPEGKVTGRMVSGNYFNVLGLTAAKGRLFSDGDDTAENANPVVVLSYLYWQRKFALSPSVIGRHIGLNGYPFTVVGVAPSGFDGDVVGDQMALFVPLSMQPELIPGRHWREAGEFSWLSILGRLKPGATAVEAQAEVNVILQQSLHDAYGAGLSADDRSYLATAKIAVSSGGAGLSGLRGNYRTPLLLLMGIVGLVLLIACVNVANLLLARASARSKEIAVRLAIGANRRRLLQQLFTESVLLAFLGGFIGSLFAIWGVPLLAKLLGPDTTLPLDPDGRVLGFTMAVCVLTGILFGLVPALRTSKVPVTGALKEAAAAMPAAGSRFAWGKGLVIGQVAISLLVLFAAGLLVRSLENQLTQDFGYDRGPLVIARLDPIAAGYTNNKMKLLAQQLAARISSTGGVRGVAYSQNGLFSHVESGDDIVVPGYKPATDHDRLAMEDCVGPEYFQTVGIPILAGRGIETQDTSTSTRVAVVNDAMVKHFFAGQNPVGRQFMIDDPDWLNKPFTIVGVSHDARDHYLREPVKPRFYMAFQQATDPGQIILEVEAVAAASTIATNVMSQIKAADPRLPVLFVDTLDNLIMGSAADQIALAKLSSVFACLALLLASIGLYGVMSFAVASRTREFGVRVALGARRVDVLRMVFGEGLILVALGLAAGIPLSLATSRLFSTVLYGLTSSDPVSLLGGVAILAVVATVAGFVPARRATKVDPNVALRYE